MAKWVLAELFYIILPHLITPWCDSQPVMALRALRASLSLPTPGASSYCINLGPNVSPAALSPSPSKAPAGPGSSSTQPCPARPWDTKGWAQPWARVGLGLSLPMALLCCSLKGPDPEHHLQASVLALHVLGLAFRFILSHVMLYLKKSIFYRFLKWFYRTSALPRGLWAIRSPVYLELPRYFFVKEPLPKLSTFKCEPKNVTTQSRKVRTTCPFSIPKGQVFPGFSLLIGVPAIDQRISFWLLLCNVYINTISQISWIVYSSFCLFCVNYLTLPDGQEARQQKVVHNGEQNLILKQKNSFFKWKVQSQLLQSCKFSRHGENWICSRIRNQITNFLDE